jgi:Predicted S-adenosylmethionine-dependent methyltransferase
MRFNAVDVLENMVEDGSVDAFHIFFPDPWPKKRHHKRRLIQPEFVSLLARKLRKDGYIYLATDWEEYAEWMKEVLNGEPLLYDPNEGKGGERPSWRPITKFERKGLDKDYVINDIIYKRR